MNPRNIARVLYAELRSGAGGLRAGWRNWRNSANMFDDIFNVAGRMQPAAPQAIQSYRVPFSPLSNARKVLLNQKVQNRTITQAEWRHLQWDRRFSNRRATGVRRFWARERDRLRVGLPGTRNWTPSQADTIISGQRPLHNGEVIFGHHRYSALEYPHIANDPKYIYPTTFSEHLNRWHLGNWRNPTHGEPLNPFFDELF